MKKIFILASIGTLLMLSSCNKQKVCSTGYTGSDCSVQTTPTKIIVSKIEVSKFPSTDTGGAGWDLTSGADIYPVLTKGSNTIWESPTYTTDANPNSSYTYTLSPSADIISPFETYSISLYDYDDLDSDDFMGGINFVPYSTTNKFPSVINVDAGGSVSFKLHLTYVF